MRLQQYSADLYRRLAQDADSPVSYHVTGSVRLAHTRERMAEFKHIASMARANGMEYERAVPDRARRALPAGANPRSGRRAVGSARRRHRSVASDASDGRPRRGAWDVGSDEASGSPGSNSNRTTNGSSRTPHGDIECEIVLNAAGYRAGEVMALLGRDLPIVSLSHQYLVTEEIPELAERATPLPLLRDPDASYYLRQERNGYILGPYEWQATRDVARRHPRQVRQHAVAGRPRSPRTADPRRRRTGARARRRRHRPGHQRPDPVLTGRQSRISGPNAGCATSSTATRSASASPKAAARAWPSPSGSSTGSHRSTSGRSTGAASRSTPRSTTPSTKRSRCTRTNTRSGSRSRSVRPAGRRTRRRCTRPCRPRVRRFGARRRLGASRRTSTPTASSPTTR